MNTESTQLAGSLEPVVSRRIIEVLEHSLGDATHFRNYFATAPDCDTWTDVQTLVTSGLMRRGREAEGGQIYFYVTEKGKKIAFMANDKAEARRTNN